MSVYTDPIFTWEAVDGNPMLLKGQGEREGRLFEARIVGVPEKIEKRWLREMVVDGVLDRRSKGGNNSLASCVNSLEHHARMVIIEARNPADMDRKRKTAIAEEISRFLATNKGGV